MKMLNKNLSEKILTVSMLKAARNIGKKRLEKEFIIESLKKYNWFNTLNEEKTTNTDIYLQLYKWLSDKDYIKEEDLKQSASKWMNNYNIDYCISHFCDENNLNVDEILTNAKAKDYEDFCKKMWVAVRSKMNVVIDRKSAIEKAEEAQECIKKKLEYYDCNIYIEKISVNEYCVVVKAKRYTSTSITVEKAMDIKDRIKYLVGSFRYEQAKGYDKNIYEMKFYFTDGRGTNSEEIVAQREEEKRQAEEAERNRKQAEFNKQVEAASNNTNKYKPTDRDWEKMIDYRNKKSDPERLAQSCKDENKLVARCVIARAMGWDEAYLAFKKKILASGFLDEPTLEAYARKYSELPEDQRMLINDLITNDLKGGFAKADAFQNGESDLFKQIFGPSVVRWIDNIPEVQSYKLEKSIGADGMQEAGAKLKVRGSSRIRYTKPTYYQVPTKKYILTINNDKQFQINVGYNNRIKVIWEGDKDMYTESSLHYGPEDYKQMIEYILLQNKII